MAAAGGRFFPHVHHGLKLTKAERKMLKKQNKAFHTLKNRAREVGEISEIPTPYLLVKNGGLMCGVKRQDLVSVFDKYGKLDDLVMIPGKSFSYVLFCDVTSAKEAMTNVNGQKLTMNHTTDTRTFYLAYLLKRPCAELCSLDTSYPAGLILIQGFISEHLEHELLQYFSSSKQTIVGSGENNSIPGMTGKSGCTLFHDWMIIGKCYFSDTRVACLYGVIIHSATPRVLQASLVFSQHSPECIITP